MAILPHKGIDRLPAGIYTSPIHNGLRLQVRPKSKSWCLRRRSPTTGKLIQQVLGHFPELDHIGAVQAAVAARMVDEAAVPKQLPPTLQEVVNHYELTYLRLHRRKPLAIVKLLNRHLGPHKHIPATLTRAEAHGILATLNHVPAAQRVWKTEMQAAFNHAMLTGLLPDAVNPWQLLKTRPFGIRQRVLNDTELAVLLPWLPTSALPETLKDVFTISLYTLARSGEVCSIEHSEVVGDTWHLPPHKSKNAKARLIPLHPTVMEILERRRGNGSVYAFPSTNKTEGHIAQHCVVNMLCRYRSIIPVAHFSLHDARRSSASQLAAMGAPENQIELALGHQRGQLVRTYQVYSYEKEIREWVMKLGAKYDGLQTP